MYFCQRIEKSNKKGREYPFLLFGILIWKEGNVRNRAADTAVSQLILVLFP